MPRRGFFLLLAFLACSNAAFSTQQKERPVILELKNALPEEEWRCVLKTPEHWQWIKEIFARHVADDWVIYHAKKFVRACRDEMVSTPALRACTQGLRGFIPGLEQDEKKSYGLGFDLSDEDYVALQSSQGADPVLDIPTEFLDVWPDLDQIEKICVKKGWPYLKYRSPQVGAKTKERFFVRIAGPRGSYIKWFAGISDPVSRRMESLTGMMGVQFKDQKGVLKPARLQYRDWEVHRGSEGMLTLNMTNNTRCYGCHSNQLKKIEILPGSLAEVMPVAGEAIPNTKAVAYTDSIAWKRVMAINQELESYRGLSWNRAIDPKKHGPVLGKAQGCVQCHNHSAGGADSNPWPLTYDHFRKEDTLETKVVWALRMPPPGAKLKQVLDKRDALPVMMGSLEVGKQYAAAEQQLTENERALIQAAREKNKKLLAEIRQDYWRELSAWIAATPCASGPGPFPPPGASHKTSLIKPQPFLESAAPAN